MADGHLNKCIECNKKDVRENRLIKLSDPIWVEKEAERRRIKERRRYYNVLKGSTSYREKSRRDKSRWRKKNVNKQNAQVRALQKIDLPKGFHRHHWSYKPEHQLSIICLSPQQHFFAHRYLRYDVNTQCFNSKEGMPLNTRIKHLEYLRTLFT